MLQVKKIILLVTCFFSAAAYGQHYFQQKVNYNIEVKLHDASKTLSGFETIQYVNQSPDTLHYIWFHLWPNAFKNDVTAFSKQLLQNGRTDFYFSNEDKKGYINRLNFTVNGKVAALENHPTHIDIAKLILPQPLLPGDTIKIQTPFHVQLPYNFSRGGYIGQSFQITQWYPKPAVYDLGGWHPQPYLDQGEFYGEFGDYQVKITVPAKYKIAASGREGTSVADENGNKTIEFSIENAHDFAWFADADFLVMKDTLQLKSGKVVQIEAWFLEQSAALWEKATGFMKDAVRFYSELLGEYPYESVKAVEVNMGFEGGMEYPGITSVSGVRDEKSLDLILAHEIGHNWFYGILGSNERDFPWVDEGMNTWYENRYAQGKYKNSHFRKMPENFLDLGYRIALSNKTDQPLNTKSKEFTDDNYGFIAYHKTALWMQKLHDRLGTEVFDTVMRKYYEEWKFKHPQPSDFKKTVAEVSGENVDELFDLLNRKGPLQAPEKKKFKISGIGSLRETDQYNYLFVAPALGLNDYDKLMIGGILHNYTLPEPKFHFIAAPLFGTKSKSFTGLGRAGFTISGYGFIRKAEIAVSAAHFNVNSFTDSTGKINYMPYTKLVPQVKLIFKNQDPLSKAETSLQWKTFIITETGIRFIRDTIEQQDIISYPESERNLHQLTFSHMNNRVLYPYSGILRAEKGKGFLRLGFDGNYFFNYTKGGGLQARFFAGKFFYVNQENISSRYATSRYHLNMTGANGYEDYTYSNYFVGRNEFEGAVSQQIMIRDGGFKIRTDLLNRKVGRSDNWLMALNLTTPFPADLNPLQVLPVDIPLKIFADIGTYAEAWQKNSPTGKFIYDAGLQISLLKDIVNVYIPLLYSEVYRNYYKSTIPQNERFWKRISFSIDVQKISTAHFLKKFGS